MSVEMTENKARAVKEDLAVYAACDLAIVEALHNFQEQRVSSILPLRLWCMPPRRPNSRVHKYACTPFLSSDAAEHERGPQSASPSNVGHDSKLSAWPGLR